MFYQRLPCTILAVFIFVGTAHGSLTCAPTEGAPAASPETVSLRAVGDLVLGNNWPNGGWPAGYEKTAPLQLKRVLGEADAIFGNFEGALTTHKVSTKTPRGTSVFAFRMPPHFATLLRDAGFGVIAVANNHTFDFGEAGYRDTVKNLADAGILVVGKPEQIALQKIRGVTLAWIGFSHLSRDNYVGDRVRLEELVKKARTLADLVIVSLQAGAEGSEALRVRDRDEIFLGENRGNTYTFAHQAIDFGADLVIGHGPHVLRGMECYRGKLIAYSLGNFAGYGTLSIQRAAAITAVLDVQLAKNRVTVGFDVIPARFDPERLPVIDEDRLAHYLITDLSLRAPLNGSVRFPATAAGAANYRRWIADAQLAPVINSK